MEIERSEDPEATNSSPRFGRFIFIVCILAVCTLCVPVQIWAGELEIHVINVQWGMSVLIRGPDGTTVLFDGGNFGRGKAEVVPYLQGLGITADSDIGYMVLSHHHQDHYGGLIEVISAGYVHVRQVYDNGSQFKIGVRPYKTYTDAVKRTAARRVTRMGLGDTIPLGSGAKVTCVAGNGKVIGRMKMPRVTDENDRSIGLLVQYGLFDFLTCGDMGGGKLDTDKCINRKGGQANIESPLAAGLIEEGYLTSHGVEVLHVNHHGSESSSNSDYVNQLTPRVAVISVGDGQQSNYQLPRRSVVENVLMDKKSCMAHKTDLILQTADGPIGRRRGSKASNAGYSVGDIVITTNGGRYYSIRATGEVGQGDSELIDAKLPQTFKVDGM